MQVLSLCLALRFDLLLRRDQADATFTDQRGWGEAQCLLWSTQHWPLQRQSCRCCMFADMPWNVMLSFVPCILLCVKESAWSHSQPNLPCTPSHCNFPSPVCISPVQNPSL